VHVVDCPTVSVAGEQTTEVTLVAKETVRLVEAALTGATLLTSPP